VHWISKQVPELRKWQEGAAGRQDRKEQQVSTFLQQLSWLTLPGKTTVSILGICTEPSKEESRCSCG